MQFTRPESIYCKNCLYLPQAAPFPSTWRSRGYQKLVATDLPEPTDNPNHKESGRIIVSGTVVKEPINTEPILITMIYHEI